MLQARSSDGLMVLLSALTKQELEYVRLNKRFFCPVCQKPVIVKAGTKVIPHFAHRSKSNCPSSKGEGPYHEKGKLLLYQWLKSQQLEVRLEPYLSDINQIPDVYLTLRNRQIAIEFQCTQTDIQSILQRNIGYKKNGIIPIWILGANQFKRLGQHHLKINSFVQQFIHKYSSEYPLTLYFFCPNTLQIATFQQIYFTTNTKAFGTFTFHKINQIKFHHLFSVPQISDVTFYHLWKKEKKKFRLMKRHQIRGREQQWHHWLYLKGTNIESLPSIVYLPVSSQHLMKTPLWDWQSRLSIDFLHPLKIGECFSLKTIEYRLRPYLNSPFDFPLVQTDQSPIQEYVQLLEQLHIIKRVSSGKFMKVKAIHFHSHIDHAVNGDVMLMNILSKEINLSKNKHNLPIIRYTN